MTELVLPTDAEQAVIDEMARFADYPVGTSIPDTKPPLFARVVLVGGRERDQVTDVPFLTLEHFALRESTAFQAASAALGHLRLAANHGRMGSEVCYSLEVAAMPQNYPLPSVPTHKRYITTIAPALRRRVTTL